MTDIMLNHAIANALWHYKRLNPSMPFDEIPRRFNNLWAAMDALVAEFEKDQSDDETETAHVPDGVPTITERLA